MLPLLHNRHPERIRLSGIDYPEKGQAFGKKATQFTSTLIHGKEVTFHVLSKDRHGRTVADVLLPDGTNVSRELLGAGLAWWYRQYSKDVSLGALEQEAQQAKRGLWADPNPIPPWEFLPRGNFVIPSRAALHRLVGICCRNRVRTPPDTPTTPIIGNRNSHVYHRLDCPYYPATKSKNRVIFQSEGEAEAAGYAGQGIVHEGSPVRRCEQMGDLVYSDAGVCAGLVRW